MAERVPGTWGGGECGGEGTGGCLVRLAVMQEVLSWSADCVVPRVVLLLLLWLLAGYGGVWLVTAACQYVFAFLHWLLLTAWCQLLAAWMLLPARPGHVADCAALMLDQGADDAA